MRWILVVLAFAALLAPRVFSGEAYAQANLPQRYVVVFAGERVPDNADQLIRAAGGELAAALPQIGVAIAVSFDLRFPTSLRRQGTVLAVNRERSWTLPGAAVPHVEESSPEEFRSEQLQPLTICDGPTAADNLRALQWNLRRVHADAAWSEACEAGSHDVVVAVIDNGVAYNHPDLRPNLMYSARCFPTPPFPPDDGLCVEDPIAGPYPSIAYPSIGGPTGAHGTMVAGIIAAAFGHGRAVGVGPKLGLASYNVFEQDNGRVAAPDHAIWAAMLDAAERGFRVINLSLGCYIRSDPLGIPQALTCAGDDADIVHPSEDAATWAAWNRVVGLVVRRGVVVVASAGNEALNVNGQVAHLPSDLPQVINVGGTGIRAPIVQGPGGVPMIDYPHPDATDVPGRYSGSQATNIGAAIDLVAPGGDCPDGTCVAVFAILSTRVIANPGCAANRNCTVDWVRGFGLVGTSFAAPHVAGVAGLVLNRNPNLQPHQVRAILKRTAEKVHDPESALSDRQEFGHGMVDALEAVNAP